MEVSLRARYHKKERPQECDRPKSHSFLGYFFLVVSSLRAREQRQTNPYLVTWVGWVFVLRAREGPPETRKMLSQECFLVCVVPSRARPCNMNPKDIVYKMLVLGRRLNILYSISFLVHV